MRCGCRSWGTRPGPGNPSIATGRELFGAHCARCHGADAKRTSQAPNLLLRVKGMSEAGFVEAVLRRYRWSLPAGEAGGESAWFEAMLHGVLARPGAARACRPVGIATRGIEGCEDLVRLSEVGRYRPPQTSRIT
ncbi:MAG: c-type cytochrome [Methylibium sp.]|nr:c-type cytochrome [Methylibium sp.]